MKGVANMIPIKELTNCPAWIVVGSHVGPEIWDNYLYISKTCWCCTKPERSFPDELCCARIGGTLVLGEVYLDFHTFYCLNFFHLKVHQIYFGMKTRSSPCWKSRCTISQFRGCQSRPQLQQWSTALGVSLSKKAKVSPQEMQLSVNESFTSFLQFVKHEHIILHFELSPGRAKGEAVGWRSGVTTTRAKARRPWPRHRMHEWRRQSSSFPPTTTTTTMKMPHPHRAAPRGGAHRNASTLCRWCGSTRNPRCTLLTRNDFLVSSEPHVGILIWKQ